MNEVMVKEYLEQKVEFKVIEGSVYANANTFTDSVKLDNWKRSANTKRYIEALNSKQSVKSTEWIIASKGGNDLSKTGTWIHEKLVLSLSRYISVDFELWMDEQIATLVREGSVSLQPQFKAPTTLKEALILALEQQEKIEELELENKNKEIKLIEQAPKVEFADKILKSKANVLIGDFAKVLCDEGLNIGEGRLFAWLRNNKILFKENGSNKPYQQYLDRGYFTCRENIVKTAFRDIISITTMLSPKGQVWLYNKLKEEEQFKK